MNAENFTDYIDNPARLYQMNYEELRQLIVQYPFNANLRYMLAKKSKQENHKDFDRNLKNAAVHSPDRRRLYHYMKDPKQLTASTLEFEGLELKPLNELMTSKKEAFLPIELSSFEEKEENKTVFFEPLLTENYEIPPFSLDFSSTTLEDIPVFTEDKKYELAPEKNENTITESVLQNVTTLIAEQSKQEKILLEQQENNQQISPRTRRNLYQKPTLSSILEQQELRQ
jgi:hypothetical protein